MCYKVRMCLLFQQSAISHAAKSLGVAVTGGPPSFAPSPLSERAVAIGPRTGCGPCGRLWAIMVPCPGHLSQKPMPFIFFFWFLYLTPPNEAFLVPVLFSRSLGGEANGSRGLWGWLGGCCGAPAPACLCSPHEELD